tara:strand:- start:76 stop:750 length:675 start_codon:yes stop_codon:yes gene_type:complete
MINSSDWTALTLTFELALISTIILLVIGTPIAWWLSQTKVRFKFLIETMVALPIVLPPTVLGFYLLIFLGPQGSVGKLVSYLGGPSLIFSFTGLVIGSIVYSMPFVIQPLQHAFSVIDKRADETAATIGFSRLRRFFYLFLPLSKTGYLSAFVLGFAHTLGEFGIVLMIGGNIPGETQVASISIYNYVEMLEYDKAHMLSLLLLLISFTLLAIIYSLRIRFGRY